MKRTVGALLAAALVLAAVWVAWAPLPRGPAPNPRHPAQTYEEAMRRSLGARDGAAPTTRPDCLPRLLTHGHPTERAVVLLHGFTNCPKQFDSLATILYARGCNVYVPLIPRHGESDRMTTALSGLTAEELARAAEEALDLAHGLGNRVTVVGLSTTGVAVAWLAEHREDLDDAVIIAPAFGPRGVPLFWTRRLASALLAAPNFFTWWDSKAKERLGGPTQSYPRFPSRALAQVYRMGFAVLDAASRAKPAAARITIVTTASDEGVSLPAAHELARRWRATGAEVRAYEFPESLGVHHDMIDPEQPYQAVGTSYPVLVDLIAGAP